jgi:hypothetical protein
MGAPWRGVHAAHGPGNDTPPGNQPFADAADQRSVRASVR